MNRQNANLKLLTALWLCHRCDAHWASEETAQPYTWRLFRLAERPLKAFFDGRAPTWLVSGPDPSLCPDCGIRMAESSLPSEGAGIVL